MEKITYTVYVLGRLWMPQCKAATTKSYDRDKYPFTGYTTPVNWAEDELEAIEDRLGLDCGDFSSIIDYCVIRHTMHTSVEDGWTVKRSKDEEIRPWADEESVFDFNDCMYGGEDEEAA